MKSKIFLVAFAMVFIITVMGLANADLGTFAPKSCVQIRTLANCSVTLNEVTSPTQTFRINTTMTNLGGQTYNYTFCNTSTLGTYTYSWSGSCLNCASDNCGNSFQIGNPYIPWILSGLGVILLAFAFIRKNEFFGLFSAFLVPAYL